MWIPLIISFVIQVILIYKCIGKKGEDLALNTTIAYVLILNIVFFVSSLLDVLIGTRHVMMGFAVVTLISLSSIFYLKLADSRESIIN